LLPIVLPPAPYRFFFSAIHRDEPYDVHAERDDTVAKTWLDPVRLPARAGCTQSERNQVHAAAIDKHRRS